MTSQTSRNSAGGAPSSAALASGALAAGSIAGIGVPHAPTRRLRRDAEPTGDRRAAAPHRR